MCKCQSKFRSTDQLIRDYLSEVVELAESFFLDRKEWSDCSKGLEDLVERFTGSRLYLGSGLNRVIQSDRHDRYGCIRSPRLVKANGGRCVSER